MKSTPVRPAAIMRLIALPPAPPTPTTLMRTFRGPLWALSSVIVKRRFLVPFKAPFVLLSRDRSASVTRFPSPVSRGGRRAALLPRPFAGLLLRPVDGQAHAVAKMGEATMFVSPHDPDGCPRGTWWSKIPLGHLGRPARLAVPPVRTRPALWSSPGSRRAPLEEEMEELLARG